MDFFRYIDVGDFVYTKTREIQLRSLIATGGEGSVYETNSEYICKIYKTEKLDKIKYKKIKLMIDKKIECVGVCWPKEIIYDEDGIFRGYLMEKALGEQMKTSIFHKKNFKKIFSTWTKRDLVKLSITILEKIQYLHGRNIVLGDINQKNILVVSSTEVYFVDTDSYQIENYPCPVGTILFTAPEIQGKRFSTMIRSLGNEYFAVATLIFMILLVGKTPYNFSNTAELLTNIRKGNFTLHLDNLRYRSEIEIGYRLIWSHLPFDIREAFYSTFKKGESRYYEDFRITAEEWYELMNQYYEVLETGVLQQRDEKADNIFPTPYFLN